MHNSSEHEITSAHKTKIPTNKEVSYFKSLRCCIYHANKCSNANNCWHFNSYEQELVNVQMPTIFGILTVMSRS